MKLMIVESPNKCKKIASYLGAGWMVRASVGHIRDLPQKDLGVDPENRFKPTYVISEGKHKVVKDLQQAAANASEVWLATDPDREGEAIAYHLRAVLRLNDNYHRVTFSEITQAAIQKALAAPRKLDMQMVAAQETRRILDRLVGYTVSPALQAQSSAGMSAGRVQSPTVKLVVEREREIEAFKAQAHFGGEITLENGLVMTLDTKPLQDSDGLVKDKNAIDDILNAVTRVTITVSESIERNVKPKPPFTTSELQQVASLKLALSPDQTMRAAQKLFEAGRITYHRTDDPNFSDDGWKMVADYLEAKGIPASSERRKWKAKDANAQEAHEGIRPSSMLDVPGEGSDEIERLYRLIYERAMAAVTVDGVDMVSKVVATSSEYEAVETAFKASGKVLKTMGWRQLMTIETAESKETVLPCLPELNERCLIVDKHRKDQVTTAPSRYTEASLVKELEKRGIGRPSTYASIFATVFRREYLELGKGRQVLPTKLGMSVVDALAQMEFMDYGYTANLESELDKIAQGSFRLMDVVEPAYKQILADLPRIKVNQDLVDAFKVDGQVFCPQCGHAIKRLQKKDSKQHFWVHVDDTHADACAKFIDDERGRPYFAELQDYKCLLCGGGLKRIYSKAKGKHLWAHLETADCAKPFYDDRSGKPVLDAVKCPSCKQPIKRLSKKGADNKKSFFWVHINDTHASSCNKYMRDERNKPVL